MLECVYVPLMLGVEVSHDEAAQRVDVWMRVTSRRRQPSQVSSSAAAAGSDEQFAQLVEGPRQQ